VCGTRMLLQKCRETPGDANSNGFSRGNNPETTCNLTFNFFFFTFYYIQPTILNEDSLIRFNFNGSSCIIVTSRHSFHGMTCKLKSFCFGPPVFSQYKFTKILIFIDIQFVFKFNGFQLN
jgi:hypothetical protein